MNVYQTKAAKLAGSNYCEVRNNTLKAYNVIKKKTKRQPHVRSAYWKKEKIFLNYFWSHLFQKRSPDRVRRLKFFNCVIELLQHTMIKSVSIAGDKSFEILHKFAG